MKKIGLLFMSLVFLFSLVSAEVILLEEPSGEYYFGQIIKSPVKVFADYEVNSILETSLICGGKSVFSEGKFISLKIGEKELVTTTVPLLRKYSSKGNSSCYIQVELGEKIIKSNEFNLRGDLQVTINEENLGHDFSPKDLIVISGSASKSNLEKVNGLVSFSVQIGEEKILSREVVNNDLFEIDFRLPSNAPAGYYIGNLTVSEKDYLGELSNLGSERYSFYVKQIEKNLEVLLDKNELNPGEELSFRVKLHDQTGKNIPSPVEVSIVDSSGKEIFKSTVNSDEEVFYNIGSKQIPTELSIRASKGNLSSFKKAIVLENRKISTEVVNKTLIVKNIGNVFFEDKIIVKISDVEKEIFVSLGIDDQEMYSLLAPLGVYDIEVNNEKISGVSLTGRAIDVRKVSNNISNFIANPFVWIFILIIIAGFGYVTYLKINRRKGSGRIYKKSHEEEYFVKEKEEAKRIISPRYSAKQSLSIKGEEQEVVGVFLKVRNLFECLKDKESKAYETIKELSLISDKVRANIYESEDSIVFIFSPVMTRTFQNEKNALELAIKIQEKLDHHNKYFKQKIEYGVALSRGKIVGRVLEKTKIEFSTKDNFISLGRKISDISQKEVLVEEGVKNKLLKDATFEKHTLGNLNYYSLKEMKNLSEGRERVNEIYRKMQK